MRPFLKRAVTLFLAACLFVQPHNASAWTAFDPSRFSVRDGASALQWNALSIQPDLSPLRGILNRPLSYRLRSVVPRLRSHSGPWYKAILITLVIPFVSVQAVPESSLRFDQEPRSSVNAGGVLPDSTTVLKVKEIFAKADQERRGLNPQDVQFIRRHLEDTAVENYLYAAFEKPQKDYPDRSFELVEILKSHLNANKIQRLWEILHSRAMGFPDAFPRIAARALLGHWGRSYPEDVFQRLQTGRLASPLFVLPDSRGARKNIHVLVISSGDSVHDQWVRRTVESRLSFGSRVRVSLSEDLGLSNLEEIIDQNPDTLYIVDVSMGEGYQDPWHVGGFWASQTIRKLGSKGVIFVLAAGNSGLMNVWAHPPFENVLYTATATRSGEQKASYSNFSLPGYLYMTAMPPIFPDVPPEMLEGTSYSAPQIAGALANLLERDSTLSERAAIDLLAMSARPMPEDPLFHRGLLGKGLLGPAFQRTAPANPPQETSAPDVSTPVPEPAFNPWIVPGLLGLAVLGAIFWFRKGPPSGGMGLGSGQNVEKSDRNPMRGNRLSQDLADFLKGLIPTLQPASGTFETLPQRVRRYQSQKPPENRFWSNRFNSLADKTRSSAQAPQVQKVYSYQGAIEKIRSRIDEIRGLADSIDLSSLSEGLPKEELWKRHALLVSRHWPDLLETNGLVLEIFEILIQMPEEEALQLIENLLQELNVLEKWSRTFWNLSGMSQSGSIRLAGLFSKSSLETRSPQALLTVIREDYDEYRFATGPFPTIRRTPFDPRTRHRYEIAVRSIRHDAWNNLSYHMLHVVKAMEKLPSEKRWSQEARRQFNGAYLRFSRISLYPSDRSFLTQELLEVRELLGKVDQIIRQEVAPRLESRDVTHTREVVSDLISFMDGNMDGRREVFQLSTLAQEAFDSVFRPTYVEDRRKRGATIAFSIRGEGASEIWINADRSKIRNILKELMMNTREMWESRRTEARGKKSSAVQSNFKSLSITLRLRRSDHPRRVILEYEDDAGGVDDVTLLDFSDDLSRQRQNAFLLRTSRREGGTGLGLAQVYELVRQHDVEGNLAEIRIGNVEHEAGSRGIRLSISLPDPKPNRVDAEEVRRGLAQALSSFERIWSGEAEEVGKLVGDQGKVFVQNGERLVWSWSNNVQGLSGVFHKTHPGALLFDLPEGEAVRLVESADRLKILGSGAQPHSSCAYIAGSGINSSGQQEYFQFHFVDAARGPAPGFAEKNGRLIEGLVEQLSEGLNELQLVVFHEKSSTVLPAREELERSWRTRDLFLQTYDGDEESLVGITSAQGIALYRLKLPHPERIDGEEIYPEGSERRRDALLKKPETLTADSQFSAWTWEELRAMTSSRPESDPRWGYYAAFGLVFLGSYFTWLTPSELHLAWAAVPFILPESKSQKLRRLRAAA